MLRPVEKQRVAEEVAEQLRSLILTGQYPVGSKLPPERELSKKLRVNRASLREALKKLEHLGLVRIRQGDGTRVQDFMETGGIELVQHLLPLSGGDGRPTRPALVGDLLEFRRLFCRELARLAAARCKDHDTGKLRGLADRADRTTSAPELFDIDFDFYIELAHIAGNQVMMLLLNTVRDGVRSFLPLIASLTGPPGAIRQHQRALIAAIEANDVSAAGAIADEYLRLGGRRRSPTTRRSARCSRRTHPASAASWPRSRRKTSRRSRCSRGCSSPPTRSRGCRSTSRRSSTTSPRSRRSTPPASRR
jgi:GntR family transcriptional repressor for pyruvate dehydrogenase complex